MYFNRSHGCKESRTERILMQSLVKIQQNPAKIPLYHSTIFVFPSKPMTELCVMYVCNFKPPELTDVRGLAAAAGFC